MQRTIATSASRSATVIRGIRAALYLLRDRADTREVALGAALPALFRASMGAAFAFPGTAGLEAEFPRYVPRIRGVWINERFPNALMTAARAR